MNGLRFKQLCLVPLVLALLIAGCQDPNKRIEQLSQELEQLRGDLAASQEQRVQAEQIAQTLQEANEGLSKGKTDLTDQNAALKEQLAEAQTKAEVAKEGQWVVGPGVAMISLPAKLLFDTGKAELLKGADKTLAQVASKIRAEFAARDIYVVGHTDNDPVAKPETKRKHPTNWHLSVHRAVTVARALQKAGVVPKRILASGCSEYRPRASNNTSEGKARNRRVEIYAVVPAAEAPRQGK